VYELQVVTKYLLGHIFFTFATPYKLILTLDLFVMFHCFRLQFTRPAKINERSAVAVGRIIA